MLSLSATTALNSITFYATAKRRADSKRTLRKLRDEHTVLRLNLAGSRINDARLLRYIAPMQQLTYLNLSNCPNITRQGVWTLFAKLPCIQQIDVEQNACFSWPNIRACPTHLPVPEIQHNSFLSDYFFSTELGKELVGHSEKVATAKLSPLSGREYLIERTKDKAGYCRGHSYAAIIAHCQQAHKEQSLIQRVHIQFFQGMEYLLLGKKAEVHSEQLIALHRKLQQIALIRLKNLAGLDKGSHTRKVKCSYSEPTFWAHLWHELRAKHTDIVEMKINRSHGKPGHSIALFLSPSFKIADLNHGICHFPSRNDFEAALMHYLQNSFLGAITTVYLRIFKNPTHLITA